MVWGSRSFATVGLWGLFKEEVRTGSMRRRESARGVGDAACGPLRGAELRRCGGGDLRGASDAIGVTGIGPGSFKRTDRASAQS